MWLSLGKYRSAEVEAEREYYSALYRLGNLSEEIPGLEELLQLTPQQLGWKILLRWRKIGATNFRPRDMKSDQWSPGVQKHKVEQALSEAWTWLHLQALVVPSSGKAGEQGWRMLSRRGESISAESAGV